jgi:enoyl-CoA hydratase/carnithine racemase
VLVSRVVKADQLQETALQLAKALLSKNQFGLRLTKEAINMNIDAGGLEQALCMEDRNQILLAVASMFKPPASK